MAKKKADAGAGNPAEALMDGQMIPIPGQSEPGQQTVSAASESTGSGTDGKININTASREQLMTLAGIGETKADQIIAYRTYNGAFQNRRYYAGCRYQRGII
ncbi:MAG: helix-hairpin-helix domain-containing protein [Eubacterium sp.]